jgi:hypothetical protein
MGNIENGKYVNVSEDLHYRGSALTNWTIVPTCKP